MHFEAIIKSMEDISRFEKLTDLQRDRICTLKDKLSDYSKKDFSQISIEELRQVRLELILTLETAEKISEILIGFDKIFADLMRVHISSSHKRTIEQLIISNKGLSDERDIYLSIFEAFVYPVLYLDEQMKIKLANVAGVALLERLSEIYFGETQFNVNFTELYSEQLHDMLSDDLSDYAKFYDNKVDAIFHFLRTEKLFKQDSGYMVYIIDDVLTVNDIMKK